MNRNEIRVHVVAAIQETARMQKIQLPALCDEHAIVDDLGFTSMALVRLIMRLEEVLGVDPFMDENVMTNDLRTIGDICDIYFQCLGGKVVVVPALQPSWA
jgi:acyl carrier protein